MLTFVLRDERDSGEPDKRNGGTWRLRDTVETATCVCNIFTQVLPAMAVVAHAWIGVYIIPIYYCCGIGLSCMHV